MNRIYLYIVDTERPNGLTFFKVTNGFKIAFKTTPALARLYICFIKRAGSNLHGVVQTGRYVLMHIRYIICLLTIVSFRIKRTMDECFESFRKRKNYSFLKTYEKKNRIKGRV